MQSATIQTALSDFWERVVDQLPTLLSVVIILLIGWVLARLLGALTRRLARRMELDTIVEQTGLARGMEQAKIARSASDLVALLVFWLVFLSFVLMSLERLGFSLAMLPLQGLIAYLPRLLAAILILVVGALVAQWVGKATQVATASMGVEFHQGLGRAAHWLVLVTAAILAVDQLGLNISLLTNLVTNVVTIAVAGLALAFGLGGRDVARNVLAGYYARELFTPGDRLAVYDEEGTLEAIGTLNAELGVNGGRLVIPNSRLIEAKTKILTPRDATREQHAGSGQ